MNIPLTKPYWGVEEEHVVVKALKTTNGAGDGLYTKKIIEQFQKLLKIRHVFPVTSCTHGLELAVIALGVKPGDEVIIPSFTMSSTANCVLTAGATPVFADIDPRTYCIDPADIKRCITKKTKGIIVVHYAGMPCDMEAIDKLAKKHNLWIIEDAAHAIGASYKGKPLGTFGDVGVFSFHGTKNVSCGEGGVVVTNRDDLVPYIDTYRTNGTNRHAFLRGEVDKYTWVSKGTSYFLSDLLAAIISVQLPKIPFINAKREAIAKAYLRALEPYKKVIQPPIVPNGAKPNWHIFAIKFSSKDLSQQFMTEMKKKGIGATFHYVPLHSAPIGKQVTKKTNRMLPVTDDVSDTLVRIPIYPGLTKKEVDFVCQAMKKVL